MGRDHCFRRVWRWRRRRSASGAGRCLWGATFSQRKAASAERSMVQCGSTGSSSARCGSRTTLGKLAAAHGAWWLLLAGGIECVVDGCSLWCAHDCDDCPQNCPVQVLSAAVCATQIPVLLLAHETLAPKSRRAFSLRKSDPLRNISRLFTHSPALRRLCLSQLCLNICGGVQQTMQSFQIATLHVSSV